MGCESCGTSKPGGCKSNGGCSTGGCNRLNTHDWLRNIPMEDNFCKVVEVSFKHGSRKEFYFNNNLQNFEKGDYVTVEATSGYDVGEVSLTGELVRLQMKKKGVQEMNPEMKKILRLSNQREVESYKIQKDREPGIQAKSREFARNLKVQMKLSEVEIQADGKKATFFYTAEDRVDFRELIRVFANEFKFKIEMRQIGIRQEAAKVGGIGSCGRELCCSTWLHDFKSVNTTAARYQNLSINQTKLSGQCGRLKCCLNYELDSYLDALQHFPDNAEVLETAKGTAHLIKKDIFKNLMWYVIPGNSQHFPLAIATVKEIKQMNVQGKRPEHLETVDVTSSKPKEVELQFVDAVGQINLRTLEKNDKRRQHQSNDRRQQNNRNQQQEMRRENGPAPKGNAPQQRGPHPNQRPGNQPQRREANPNQNKNQPQQQRNNQPQRKEGNPNQNRNQPPQQRNNQPPNKNQKPPENKPPE